MKNRISTVVLLRLCLIVVILFLLTPNLYGRRKKREKKTIKTTTQQIKQPHIEEKKIAPQKTFPTTIPVESWENMQITLLSRAVMFQKFGYSLFTVKDPENAKNAIDSQFTLGNYRLKYDSFKEKKGTIKTVTKHSGNEYLCTIIFNDPAITVYGITKDGTLEGVAPSDDIVKAKKRWLGSTVFARQRHISTYDPQTSSFTKQKISITEPLQVTDVRWGVLPLPPKPIWLAVKTTNGTDGIIPLHFSYTNVLKSQIDTLPPWHWEIFEKNPKELYSWDNFVWETIERHNVFIGMTQTQALISWGKQKKNETINGQEIFHYSGKSLVFKNSKLIATK